MGAIVKKKKRGGGERPYGTPWPKGLAYNNVGFHESMDDIATSLLCLLVGPTGEQGSRPWDQAGYLGVQTVVCCCVSLLT